jgi:predicted acyl esterase
MRRSTDRRASRPVGPAAAALSKMLSRAWSLPPQRNFVASERNVQVPMSDGTVLLADHYLPIYTIGPSTSNLVLGQTAGKAAAHA